MTDPFIRAVPQTDGPATTQLQLGFDTIGRNLIPLVLFVALIALGLRLFPNVMIRGFMVFGRALDAAIKLILAGCIIEYFTQAFSSTVGWRFDPIIADEEDRFRALEVAGYIGLMLAGAFPMVYLIRKYLEKPVNRLGELAGLEGPGAAGILAALANVLAMFRLVREMRPQDKVLNIAFAVCAAFLFGDHLSFTANFQPNLIAAVMLGKLGGGIAAILLAYRLSVPRALELNGRTTSAKSLVELNKNSGVKDELPKRCPTRSLHVDRCSVEQCRHKRICNRTSFDRRRCV